MCDIFDWNHLPVEGGIFDQDPLLLDQLQFIFYEREKYREEQEKRKQNETRRSQSGGNLSRMSSRPRR